MNTYLHIALNVQDLERSVRFYTLLFDLPPDKVAAGYVRFTLKNPPLVLGLNASKHDHVKNGNRVEHFGLRLASSNILEAVRSRLANAGLIRKERRRMTCCHAVQDKIWTRDPDGNEWEVYELIQDLQPSDKPVPSSRKDSRSCCAEK